MFADEKSAALRSEQLKLDYENALYAKDRQAKKAMELAIELTGDLDKTSTTNKAGSKNRSVNCPYQLGNKFPK